MSLESTLAAPSAAVLVPPTFEALYDAHVDGVWRTLARLGVASMNIDDAAQEVFVTAWKRLAAFEKRSSVKTWLTGIALNVAAHHRRSASRRGGTEPLDASMPSSAPSPDETAERRQDLVVLERVLSKLNDEQREVFVMMEMEGFSAPEASALLAVKENTVYSRLRLARAAFNTAVAELKETAR